MAIVATQNNFFFLQIRHDYLLYFLWFRFYSTDNEVLYVIYQMNTKRNMSSLDTNLVRLHITHELRHSSISTDPELQHPVQFKGSINSDVKISVRPYLFCNSSDEALVMRDEDDAPIPSLQGVH